MVASTSSAPAWCRRAAAICAAAALATALHAGARAQAQQPTSSEVNAADVTQWLESADRFVREHQPDQAAVWFERVIEHAPRLGLDEQLAKALCATGEILYEKGQWSAARERGLKAAAIYERLGNNTGIGRVDQLLSASADILGNRAEAEDRARRALAAYEALGDRRGRAIATLLLIRVSDLSLGEKQRLGLKAVEDARAAGDRRTEGRALHSLGDRYFGAASYEEALETLLQAAAVLDEATDRVALGTVYNSIGRVYRAHGRLDEALRFQLKALALHEAAGSPYELIQSLNAVAVTHQSLGNARSAREYFARALAEAEKASSPRIQDTLRANLASLMINQGDYAEAGRVLEGVIARGLDPYPTTRMIELSIVDSKLGRLDEALSLAQKAVNVCADRDSDCLHATVNRARTYAAMNNLDAALGDITTALEKIEVIRGKLIPADFFKQRFNLAQEEVYSSAIALQMRSGMTKDALATAELARSRSFVDLLAARSLQPRDVDAVDTLPLVFRGPPSASLDRNRGLPSQVAARAASVDDLIESARRVHSTLLTYWVTSDRLFIWVVGSDGQVHTAQSEVPSARLTELIRATSSFADNAAPEANDRSRQRGIPTRGALSIVAGTDTTKAWRELYALLVKPIRAALPRQPGALITIVPHGPLSALSFAALQDERGRYLLEDYTLHYVPAGAVLQFTSARRHPQARRGAMLLIADPVPPALSKLEAPLPRLAGARIETRAIAGLVPRARVTSLEGEAATKNSVRAAAAGKSVLHFATHAIVRDADPFGSFLALSPATRNVKSDGLLTAQEIYGLNLDADLVVLSACRSAGGQVTGDGIATFARAFMYAGTPTLVASIWDVADQPTSQLLPDFYRAWLAGATKAGALRTAQLRLLRDLRAHKVQIDTPAGKILLPEHPVFWAGFALFGEPD
jgi:CHAT domain-containing protein/tetratricopeptide (TPR) repeat protein